MYAHIFFYETAEAVNLQQAIGRHLENETIRNGLLHLVRLFPPEEIVPEPEFRGVHHLPATAVRSVLEQLYALPVVVAYDLRQASEALAVMGAEAPYRPAKAFERPFSSLLSIDVIRPSRENNRLGIVTHVNRLHQFQKHRSDAHPSDPDRQRRPIGSQKEIHKHCIGVASEGDKMLAAWSMCPGEPVLHGSFACAGPAHHRFDGLMRRTKLGSKSDGDRPFEFSVTSGSARPAV